MKPQKINETFFLKPKTKRIKYNIIILALEAKDCLLLEKMPSLDRHYQILTRNVC